MQTQAPESLLEQAKATLSYAQRRYAWAQRLKGSARVREMKEATHALNKAERNLADVRRGFLDTFR